MSAGRTTWWPKDAAWHRRERIVALGEEFGPAGPLVLDVLSAWAQEQRAGGDVRGGFRILAREAFVDTDEARRIVERADELGALDDLDVTVSHGQFTCRVSGWSADQERGRAAVRKAAQRAGSHGESRSDHQEQSEKPEEPPRESRSVTPSTQPDLTKPDQKNNRERALTFRGKRVPAEVANQAEQLLAVFNDAAGRDLNAVEHLRQIAGALLRRPDVTAGEWERATWNTVRNPPGFVDGEVQLGHIFGEKAADHALANTGTPASRPASVPPVAESVERGRKLIREMVRGAA